MAVGQNLLRYLFGVGKASPLWSFLKAFWDVHRGTGVLTHCQMASEMWQEEALRGVQKVWDPSWRLAYGKAKGELLGKATPRYWMFPRYWV